MPDEKTCVYYDGACPVCRAEINTYRKTQGADDLIWIDASTCQTEQLGPGLSRSEALAKFHARRPDGTLVSGAAAFAEIWATLPRWRWLAHLARLPGILTLLDFAYTLFLRIRPIWRKKPVH